MANSNLTQRHPSPSLWLFIAGMFAASVFIIGLIFLFKILNLGKRGVNSRFFLEPVFFFLE